MSRSIPSRRGLPADRDRQYAARGRHPLKPLSQARALHTGRVALREPVPEHRPHQRQYLLMYKALAQGPLPEKLQQRADALHDTYVLNGGSFPGSFDAKFVIADNGGMLRKKYSFPGLPMETIWTSSSAISSTNSSSSISTFSSGSSKGTPQSPPTCSRRSRTIFLKSSTG